VSPPPSRTGGQTLGSSRGAAGAQKVHGRLRREQDSEGAADPRHTLRSREYPQALVARAIFCVFHGDHAEQHKAAAGQRHSKQPPPMESRDRCFPQTLHL